MRGFGDSHDYHLTINQDSITFYHIYTILSCSIVHISYMQGCGHKNVYYLTQICEIISILWLKFRSHSCYYEANALGSCPVWVQSVVQEISVLKFEAFKHLSYLCVLIRRIRNTQLWWHILCMFNTTIPHAHSEYLKLDQNIYVWT